MSEIDDYLAEVEPAKRELIAHYYERALAIVPEAVPGRKYAMPCLVHRGKGLISIMATKAGLSIIPFSGSLNGQVAGDFETSENGGSLYLTVERPFPDDRFDELIRLKVAQTDGT